jgi:hypothetical protein
MGRTERRLFRLNDDPRQLRHQAELAEAELGFHGHLSDDATRDALVSDSPADRADARAASKDMARLGSALTGIRARIEKLERKRDRLLERFQD